MDDPNRTPNLNAFLAPSVDRRRVVREPSGEDPAVPVLLPPGRPPRLEPVATKIEGYDPNKVYGVTRRFSLATLMLMMAATSLLLAATNLFTVPAYVSGAMILLCIATAVGQMFLFHGDDPRLASLIVGVVCCPLLAIFMLKAGAWSTFRHTETGEIIAVAFTGLLFGAPLGYAAGCVVAGVLLLMDLTESKLVRWRKVREPDEDPWPPPKPPNSPENAMPRNGNLRSA
jgi:hypothetical protein